MYYAITEIVRCRSWNETGVWEALDECASRWLTTTLELSPASVIIVFGKNARTALQGLYGLDEEKLAGPLNLAGRSRLVAFLPHPNARGNKTVIKVLGEEGIARLRSALQ